MRYHPSRGRSDQVPAVVGHASHVHQVRLLGRGMDESIRLLRRAQRMEVDGMTVHARLWRRALPRLGKARIEKARPVLRPAVGVDQHPIRPAHALAGDEERLIVKPGVAREEVAIPPLLRCGEAFVIEQRGQPFAQQLSAG